MATAINFRAYLEAVLLITARISTEITNVQGYDTIGSFSSATESNVTDLVCNIRKTLVSDTVADVYNREEFGQMSTTRFLSAKQSYCRIFASTDATLLLSIGPMMTHWVPLPILIASHSIIQEWGIRTMTSVLFLLIQPNMMTEIRMQCWSEWTSGLTLREVDEEQS